MDTVLPFETVILRIRVLFIRIATDWAIQAAWHRRCCPKSVQKTSLYISAMVLLLAAIAAKAKAAMNKLAPVGYQDEQGFHEGVAPKQTEKSWPPVW